MELQEVESCKFAAWTGLRRELYYETGFLL